MMLAVLAWIFLLGRCLPQEEAMPAFSNTRSASCAVIQYAVNDLTIHISTGL